MTHVRVRKLTILFLLLDNFTKNNYCLHFTKNSYCLVSNGRWFCKICKNCKMEKSKPNPFVAFLLSSLIVLFMACSIFCQEKIQFAKPLTSFKNFSEFENFTSFLKFAYSSGMQHVDKATYLNNKERSLYTSQQINSFSWMMKNNLYGNPHSESKSSLLSNDLIDALRKSIINFFNTTVSDYTVVFTHSSKQSMKLVLEAFPFTNDSTLYFKRDSSIDIYGFQTYAKQKEAKINIVDDLKNVKASNERSLIVTELVNEATGEIMKGEEINELLQKRDNNTFVIADASLYLNKEGISLKEMNFDAVAFSFDKVVGYPSLGVLLLNKRMISFLDKPYFGGGTLVYALTQHPFEKLRLKPSERFEDGSLPFLTLSAANLSINILSKFGAQITNYISSLGETMFEKLNELKHANGNKAVKMYSDKADGSFIFAFNALFSNGTQVNTKELIKKGREQKIIMSEVFIDGKSYASASLGWLSTQSDISSLCSLIESYK